jgi:hypothetical protein
LALGKLPENASRAGDETFPTLSVLPAAREADRWCILNV